jgi:uncharacterized phage protein gp47/JayE
MEHPVKDLDLASINLVIDDRDPQAIFDASLARFMELAPTARPRNGSVEAILLECFATASADVIYALNRFISATVEGVLGLYGIARFAGAPALGTVTITLDGVRDLTIATGQRLTDPGTGLILLVTADTTITGADTITVPVATEDNGGAGNAITAGTAVDLVDAIPYAVSAIVATGLTGGADAESDASYIDRASTVLARVTSSLVLPIHFTAFALQDVRVGRATSVDLFTPGGTIGADLGHLTVFTYGWGAVLSAAVREEIRVAMQTIAAALVTVHVEDATIITQDVTVDVHALPGYSTTDLRAAIEAAITGYLSPATWTWGESIRQTDLIALAAAVPGVDYVDSVTVPAATITLDPYDLATVGTITCTVAT